MFVLQKLCQCPYTRSCRYIVDAVTVSCEMFCHDPERYFTQSEMNITREIFMQDIEVFVVTETLRQCASRTKEY